MPRYIIAWRAGWTNFLQSSLTRAIFFSACTTAIAFGSLWLSHHPGTSSMGKLMALSLKSNWMSADGRARIEVAPKGDGNDNAVLSRFVSTVRTIEPAAGKPVFIIEAAATMVKAFL